MECNLHIPSGRDFEYVPDIRPHKTNASEQFKKDVAFANKVIDSVCAKINEQSENMLDDAIKLKPSSGFVHNTENIGKPKSNWFSNTKREVAKKIGFTIKKGKVIVIKNNG